MEQQKKKQIAKAMAKVKEAYEELEKLEQLYLEEEEKQEQKLVVLRAASAARSRKYRAKKKREKEQNTMPPSRDHSPAPSTAKSPPCNIESPPLSPRRPPFPNHDDYSHTFKTPPSYRSRRHVDNDVIHAFARREESARRSQANDEAVLSAFVHGMTVQEKAFAKYMEAVEKTRDNAAAREAALKQRID